MLRRVMLRISFCTKKWIISIVFDRKRFHFSAIRTTAAFKSNRRGSLTVWPRKFTIFPCISPEQLVPIKQTVHLVAPLGRSCFGFQCVPHSKSVNRLIGLVSASVRTTASERHHSSASNSMPGWCDSHAMHGRLHSTGCGGPILHSITFLSPPGDGCGYGGGGRRRHSWRLCFLSFSTKRSHGVTQIWNWQMIKQCRFSPLATVRGNRHEWQISKTIAQSFAKANAKRTNETRRVCSFRAFYYLSWIRADQRVGSTV